MESFESQKPPSRDPEDKLEKKWKEIYGDDGEQKKDEGEKSEKEEGEPLHRDIVNPSTEDSPSEDLDVVTYQDRIQETKNNLLRDLTPEEQKQFVYAIEKAKEDAAGPDISEAVNNEPQRNEPKSDKEVIREEARKKDFKAKEDIPNIKEHFQFGKESQRKLNEAVNDLRAQEKNAELAEVSDETLSKLGISREELNKELSDHEHNLISKNLRVFEELVEASKDGRIKIRDREMEGKNGGEKGAVYREITEMMQIIAKIKKDYSHNDS